MLQSYRLFIRLNDLNELSVAVKHIFLTVGNFKSVDIILISAHKIFGHTAAYADIILNARIVRLVKN